MAETGKSGDRKRAERLKAALRENLRRRKAQAKGRTSPPPAGEGKEGKAR
jgi:hypothetical protein